MIKNILKWQGGKSELMDSIKTYLPPELYNKEENITAIDAFCGGGSVFMYFLNNCPGIKRLIINDYNSRLIRLYYDIKEQPQELINELTILQDTYNTAIDRSKVYYEWRDKYNKSVNSLSTSALLLCLNRTCFNGLYRENQKGVFNASWGKKDTLNYTEDFIRDISGKLNSITIYFTYGDFSITGNYITENNTFIYLDPPYRPLTGSNSFTNYVSSPFNDNSQIRLKEFCDDAIKYFNSKVMVSNSYDPNDNFLINLYKGYNIRQITATRKSGGKGAMRGNIQENLITNY